MDCFPMPCHYQSICMALLDFRLQCLFTSIPQSFWRIRHVTFVCQLDPHNNNIMYPNTCSGLTIAQQQLFITGSPNLILLSRSSNSSRLKRAKDLLPGWHQWFSAAISDAIFWYQQETIPKIIKYIYIYIKHDSNQVSSQLFRHVWLRHLTLWETCPAFSETFSPTSGVRVMVRSCPEVRQQPLRRFVGQLDRALQEADGDPHPGDIWPHGA